jgi:hypothetical protein
MEDSGISPREFSRPLQGPEAAIPGEPCDYCGQPVPRRRRGRPGKFHPACRRAFDREARRAGGQVLRRRRARASRPASPHLDAAARKILALLIAAGSAATGIPIPNRAPRWVTKEQRRVAKADPARIPEGQG